MFPLKLRIEDLALSKIVRWSLNLSLFVGSWGSVGIYAWILWRIATSSRIFGQPDTGTLIQVDLLQGLAFLVAWTAFVITLTVKVINVWNRYDLRLQRLRWRMDHESVDMSALKQQTAELEAKVEGRQALYAQQVADLEEENERLRQRLNEHEQIDPG